MTDGATPSNEGRGYVLRRILRRAVRYGRQYLPCGTGVSPVDHGRDARATEPFLCRLVPVVVDAMSGPFPELKENPDRIIELIRDEEESFIKTLDRGIALFEDAADRARKAGQSVISGEDAFKLHDTYGFPIDLTEVMARERGMTVDTDGFDELMNEARWRAREGGKADGLDPRQFASEFFSAHGPTDDSSKYATDQDTHTVTEIVRYEPPFSRSADEPLAAGENAMLILPKTCFYAEAGGQVGDQGVITGPSLMFHVRDTQRIGDTVVHSGTLAEGTLKVGDTVELRVDSRRAATMLNHTATHILNWALREVLELGGGGKVDQKGSLVDPDKTRFDFSHNKPLTPEEVERIEALCNEHIRADRLVYTKEVAEAEARKIKSLRAVFGEKYPDMVRVVSVGADIDAMLADPQNAEWAKYPLEFCGGTHVKRSSEIGTFILTTEESVAKGIRRLVGITGEKAQRAIDTGKRLRERAESIKAGPPDQAARGLAELQKEMTDAEIPIRDRLALRQAVADLQQIVKQQSKQQATESAGLIKDARRKLLDDAERVNGVAVVVGELPDVPVAQVREAADWLRTQAGSAAVCLAVRSEGKPLLIAAMTDDLVAKGLKAGDLIKHVVPAIEGRGGGKPNLAQAGGTKAEGIPDALAAAAQWIRQKIES